MASQTVMLKFVTDLKSRNEDTRNRAAKDLHNYVTTELREVQAEELNTFLDYFNGHIFEMVSSADSHAKLGGILAIVALINADVCNTSTRISRFGNYLKNNCLASASTDTAVIELATKAIARLTQVSYTANVKFEFIDHEVKRAFEWLGGERNEGKRYAAVLVLREIAFCMPTFFFQNVQQFFDVIFNAVKDPKPALRESAVNALRAGLVVTAQRETAKQSRHQYLSWYNHCYDEADRGFDEVPSRDKGITREDRIHGSLLIISELLCCSNAEWERKNRELEDMIAQELTMVQRGSISASEKLSVESVKRVYQSGLSGLNRQSRAGGSVTQIPFNWFGSVPVGKEPVVESQICRQMLTERFERICGKVLAIAKNTALTKNVHIQNSLLVVLPKLAALQRAKFVAKYLGATVGYLDRLLQGKDSRYNAFIAIGLLAVATGTDIKDHLRNILTIIRQCLPTKESANKKRQTNLDPAIFACISMLARAVKHTIRHEVASMLDSMLQVGLSPALTIALHELAIHIPSLKKEIADGLLRILSLILMQKQFAHPGTPTRLLPPLMAAGIEPPDTASVVLGLRTLGTFDFEGHSLLTFVKHCADTYLHSEEKVIRLEAVKTCSALLKGTLLGLAGRKSQTVISVINDVLAKLLKVGITDQDPDVRSCVLECLDECFDYHLAQAENLSDLFVALHDEYFEIRELAICIIGRLSFLNPAYIMPTLRRTLIQLLIEMEHSGIGRIKEQSARILGHLVSHAPKLIRPYVEPILKVLIPKLRESDLNPMVITSILRAIGDLAQVGGVLLCKYVEELFPLLLEMLNDASSSQKREVTLWTLAQLVESTGHVVSPYHRYPTLLDTLLSFLRTEQRPSIRSQTLRLLGALGALDPYKHKMNTGQIDSTSIMQAPLIPLNDTNTDLEQSYEMSPSEMLVNMSLGTLEEFYPSVAIATLMKILRDPTLVTHHTAVVQSVTFIFQSLGLKAVPYIPQVIPSMLNVIRTSDTAYRDTAYRDKDFRDFLFQQLGLLIGIVKQHIRGYLQDIFNLIKEFWTLEAPRALQSIIIILVEHIAGALGSEFKVYLPQLIPQILRVLMHDNSKERNVTQKLLVALQKFGNTLDDYIHVILPEIVKLFDSHDVPYPVRRASLECIAHLAEALDFSEYASRIIHPIVRCLDNSSELRPACMEALSAVVMQLGRKYIIFVPMVHKVLSKHKVTYQRYDILVTRITQSDSSLDFADLRRRRGPSRESSLPPADAAGAAAIRRQYVSTAHLQKAWAVSRRVSKDDWMEWHRRLSVELLKESPSPALRACWGVAQQYSQLAKDLFNASFVSWWSELDATQQDDLMNSLEQALTVPDLPEISQTILNLAEFMEHCEKGPLPLDPVLLGEQAMKCRAYAKALHYKEDEFKHEQTVPVLEALISINNKLGQKEAAAGLLEWGRKNLQGDLKVQERWYEKLHDWDKALEVYKQKADQLSDDPEVILGKMRCLEALGEWGDLHAVSEEHWDRAQMETRQRMARMASSAAWGRGEWEAMAEYTQMLPRESQDGAFYRAVLCVHHEQWKTAQDLIDLTRELLDTEVTALSLESYQRAYPSMVCVQMLAELEEVIEYKLVPERRSTIRDMWWKRLDGCQRVVEDWQRIMQVRSLVLAPHEDQKTRLKYASLCRKSGRLHLSQKMLVQIFGYDPSESLAVGQQLPTTHPQATFAFCKHLWSSERKDVALNQLQLFVTKFLQPKILQLKQDKKEEAEEKEFRQLLAKCYLKLGHWQESLRGLGEDSITEILQCYAAATEYDNNWYKAWHSYAVTNFETVLLFKHDKTPINSNVISKFAVPALKGFVRSINLSKGSSLQDTLRLLTLLFDYGHQAEMYEALHDGIRTIDIDNWLQVIPQLIARIDNPLPLVSRLIHQLLMEVGKHHPQALVYSLTVACKSSNPARKFAANKVLNRMKEHSESLVNHAVMVSDELIRVAILWHEQWHEGLEEASRLFFGEKNIPGMLATLEPLHAMLDEGPQTLKETSFQQAYGNDLNEAKKWCQRYKLNRSVRDLNQAWDLYYHVFRRISRQLPQLTQLELQYVSPKLLLCRDLELAVPGSYVPNHELIRISQVQQSLTVITSKQRPRKLSIRGHNGRTYMFLLKGHEDLRQDERVMQFFSLVNSLLLNDPETYRKNLSIQRFAVIPLSTNSGLIGWVPNSDTLHGLIKNYREKKKILLNIEHRIMQRMTPDYDHLPLMNKVEVFEHSLEHTEGDDLANLLLLKSPSSEVWFDRRTNLTRSLAVMSMVGYVLGLGDRHPSNLLLDRMSGKILHIDFGDCFEVAMTREKYPEKIPFRLTRMLINAMEVTGIEGTYRCTCESVVKVLRRNKDSLMAVLEAFVYDPLLNWRLIETKRREADGGNALNADRPPPVDEPPEPEVAAPAAAVNGGNEELNKKAIDIINRVRDKLTGRDFDHEKCLEIHDQVDLLIRQATSNENLCQCYIGWCPFW